MAARQCTPVIGVPSNIPVEDRSFDGVSLLDARRWQITTSYRWQRSHRHFIGSQEQVQRLREGTEVVNNIHLLDLSVRYAVNPQFSLSVGLPIMEARRKPGRVIYPDQISRSAGIGDLSITGRYGLFKNADETGQNVFLGLGVKLPTGKAGVRDTVRNINGIRNEIVVDQSIQPGDGGVGIILDFQAYKDLKNVVMFYGTGTYLINPRNTNGVRTGRSRPSEAVMSVADQYLARAGAIVPLRRFPIHGVMLSGGARIEGVPVRDLIGKSDGFRLRKLLPIYGDPDDTSHAPGDDSPLPPELKYRINTYIEERIKIDPGQYKKEVEESSTFNAFIRTRD